MSDIQTSLHGRRLGLTPEGNLMGQGLQITDALADASITVGDESTDVRTITIQLKDINGKDLAYSGTVFIGVFSDATRHAFATGGSTGLAIGTDGALLALVAKKLFMATSEDDGDIDLTWTDTGTESVSVGILLPTGRWVMSTPFANAGS